MSVLKLVSSNLTGSLFSFILLIYYMGICCLVMRNDIINGLLTAMWLCYICDMGEHDSNAMAACFTYSPSAFTQAVLQ